MGRQKTDRQEALAKLREAVEKSMAKKPFLSQAELELEEEKRRIGQELMAQKLAALPTENERPKACPLCGKSVRIRARNVERTFTCLSGTHTIRRNYHYCEGCKEGFCPRDEFLGLPKEGALSQELEKRVADFAVNDVYEMAERRWNFHYPKRASANQFRQVAKRLGQAIEETNAVVLQGMVAPPAQETPQTLYVMNDGGMVPMREGKWNEVKVGVMFREENHLRATSQKRGQVSSARYVALLGQQDEFKEEMRAALQVEGAAAAKRVVWVGDGAAGNWALASMLAPGAIQVLDWYHAIENAMTCAKSLFGEGDACLPSWKERIEELLATDKVEEALSELRQCLALGDNSALADLLRYYDNNKERMRYGTFIAQGLLIGSGIVESAHRHVIQTRMKKAGQHWGVKGGRQMARMRAA